MGKTVHTTKLPKHMGSTSSNIISSQTFSFEAKVTSDTTIIQGHIELRANELNCRGSPAGQKLSSSIT